MPDTQKNILIGTSGYAYEDWIGVFYPRDLPKDAWLNYYAEQFDFCELNFTYYRMPTPAQMEKYAEAPLQVAIKAHKSLTHDRIQGEAARQDFLEAAKVLQESGSLTAVLLQFPFSFNYTKANRIYLLGVMEYLGQLPLIVEFRHPDWIRASVFQELQRHGWGISMLDSPQVKGGMPAFDAVSGELAYLRFHGRNQENWWTGNNVSRYDYEYTQEELKTWIPRIMEMSKLARTTYISFNNHARGQAIKNAIQLRELLKPSGQ